MAKPIIRIKGFDEKWTEGPIGRILRYERPDNYIVSNGDYSDDYGTPVLTANKGFLLGYTKESNTYNDTCIIFDDFTLDCKYVDFPFMVKSSAIKILSLRDPNLFDLYFVYCLLNSVNIEILGHARHYISVVQPTIVHYPSYKEQCGISNFFNTLDSLIQTINKKIVSLKQLKAASLVSMFPQAGETKPRVRFKGFEGEWKRVKLSSLATRVTRKNTKLESNLPLTISSKDGLIAQISFFNNIVASNNISNYYLLKKGEFAYNKSYSNGFPFGSVKRLDKYDMGVLSTLYIVFSINDTIDSAFLVRFFETDLWHKDVAERAAEGARNHGLLNIGADDFLDINILVPKEKDEQIKLGGFFQSLDKQITAQEQRLEKLKQIKSACLNKMFV